MTRGGERYTAPQDPRFPVFGSDLRSVFVARPTRCVAMILEMRQSPCSRQPPQVGDTQHYMYVVLRGRDESAFTGAGSGSRHGISAAIGSLKGQRHAIHGGRRGICCGDWQHRGSPPQSMQRTTAAVPSEIGKAQENSFASLHRKAATRRRSVTVPRWATQSLLLPLPLC